MPVAPLWARARVAGTVIKRGLKRVTDFFFFLMYNRDPENLDFQFMITSDSRLNAKIATQGEVKQWTWLQ